MADIYPLIGTLHPEKIWNNKKNLNNKTLIIKIFANIQKHKYKLLPKINENKKKNVTNQLSHINLVCLLVGNIVSCNCDAISSGWTQI